MTTTHQLLDPVGAREADVARAGVQHAEDVLGLQPGRVIEQ